MYLMVGFDPTPVIPSDVEFSQLLLREENVSVLPGTVSLKRTIILQQFHVRLLFRLSTSLISCELYSVRLNLFSKKQRPA